MPEWRFILGTGPSNLPGFFPAPPFRGSGRGNGPWPCGSIYRPAGPAKADVRVAGSSLERGPRTGPGFFPAPPGVPEGRGNGPLIGTVQAGRVTFGSPRDPQNAAAFSPGGVAEEFLRHPRSSQVAPAASLARPSARLPRFAVCSRPLPAKGDYTRARSFLPPPDEAFPVRFCLGSPTTGGSSLPGASPANEAFPVRLCLGSPTTRMILAGR